MDLVASNYCHVKIDGEKMTTWRFITGESVSVLQQQRHPLPIKSEVFFNDKNTLSPS
jgi:hypothetical protein